MHSSRGGMSASHRVDAFCLSMSLALCAVLPARSEDMRAASDDDYGKLRGGALATVRASGWLCPLSLPRTRPPQPEVGLAPTDHLWVAWPSPPPLFAILRLLLAAPFTQRSRDRTPAAQGSARRASWCPMSLARVWRRSNSWRSTAISTAQRRRRRRSWHGRWQRRPRHDSPWCACSHRRRRRGRQRRAPW